MKRILFLIVACALVSGAVIDANGQGVTQSVSGTTGEINWTSQVVRATGIAVPGGVGGRAGMIRVAEMDALRQILETVKGMQLSAETTVENYMLTSDVIRSRVEGIVRDYRRVGDPVYMSDGSIEITVEMDLRGAGRFYDAILSPQMGGAQPMVTGPVGTAGVYTGLVIDARGMGIRPAIAPRILSDSGDEIYGSRVVDRQWAIQQGMVGYARDMDSARTDERVLNSPMVLTAIRVTGANRTDVVISDDNARMLHGVAENFRFLQECRVIIVVD